MHLVDHLCVMTPSCARIFWGVDGGGSDGDGSDGEGAVVPAGAAEGNTRNFITNMRQRIYELPAVNAPALYELPPAYAPESFHRLRCRTHVLRLLDLKLSACAFHGMISLICSKYADTIFADDDRTVADEFSNEKKVMERKIIENALQLMQTVRNQDILECLIRKSLNIDEPERSGRPDQGHFSCSSAR